MTAVSAAAGFARAASSYRSELNPLRALERRAMRARLRWLQPARVIDVGCGTADALLCWQRTGACAIGADISAPMLSEARRLGGVCGQLVQAEAGQLPFAEGAADLVVCSLALSYIDDAAAALAEMARVAAAGGYVAVSDLHPAAAAAGWKRSFRDGLQQIQIAHTVTPLASIRRIARDCSLCEVGFDDVRFGQPELPIFQRAGKAHLFASMTAVPALFVGLWRKSWS